MRFFLALARAKTMSEAGRLLAVKHTTVARRIKVLEETLSTRLFKHTPDGYIMTVAGENIYQHALIMEEKTQVIAREVFGLDSLLQGSLKLTAAHDVLKRLVIPHLGEFTSDYPKIEIELSTSLDLVDLAARHADVALRLTGQPPDYLIGKKVLPLCHGIYASTQYLQSNPQNNKVILWKDEHQNPEWVQQHFNNAHVVMRANNISSILSCVNNHIGIARLPCYIGDSCANLRRFDLPLTASSWGIWVLSHVDLRATAKVKVCRDFLIDIITKQKTLIEGLDSNYL